MGKEYSELKKEEKKRVICVHTLIYPDRSKKNRKELPLLADTLGYNVVAEKFVNINRVNPKTFIGKGHIESIAEIVKEEEIEAVLIDTELSPSQFHNLEEELDSVVLTRTEVILLIFSMRAKTQISRLQVELAYLEFDAPRLKGKWTHFSRIKGGAGVGKGMGETQLEVDRRRSKARIAHIKKELSRFEKSKKVARKSRMETFRVALVGYTNAGKSSLFNVLVKENTYVENKLFATLDTYTRKLYLGDDFTGDAIISDTVGFIKDLPHSLVESFKSTLAEVNEASLLLHVVDACTEDIESIIESVEEVLREVGATEQRRLLLLNKIDLLSEEERFILLRKYPEALFISAKEKKGLSRLRESLKDIAKLEEGYL